jgi:hypothetical protein
MTEFEKMHEEYLEMLRLFTIVQTNLDFARSEMYRLCPHDDLVDKKSYMSGGYDYYDVSEYWKQCQVCGHKIDYRKVYGNQFG